MIKFYYDFEHDELLTSDDLTKFYNLLSEEEKEDYNNDVNYYIECCMEYNNGCCIPIETQIDFLRDKIRKASIDMYDIDNVANCVLMLQDIYKFIEKHNG